MHLINSISENHRLLSLPEPLHPLVSVVRVGDIKFTDELIWERFAMNFYCISLKKNINAKTKYGQQYYDYDKGLMTFVAPKQVLSLDSPFADALSPSSGYALFVHPDFLYKHPLATTIKGYGFFSYKVNEALHLSEKEEKNIVEIFQKIEEEYQHIDRHTQDIILSQIDLLLNYSNRFYERQFITRKAVNHDILTRVETLLNEYLDNKSSLEKGLPSVEALADQLHLSPHYLSDVLRSLTGQSAQQHIQEKLIEKAKEYLSVTNFSVAEIAYQLGFEHPQSFNKLFKKKMNVSPLEFRQTFN
ncbi:helix-turn-helix domain-containing protein [Mucilaginibacter jinjuensis]|uniref:Helix-turn-helix transcriptional regulator n=1 Tax=Mucilaginibacter jinjuensis TaxID=1176721 RepID=A0ABY7T533_9SPHI|nr:response regulator transcription factor [Mucilaginibacter jinjuensis]WCT11580.1 helix-turn-helix transcriptional regulator [Mucilaginibacter jinjuensis]